MQCKRLSIDDLSSPDVFPSAEMEISEKLDRNSYPHITLPKTENATTNT